MTIHIHNTMTRRKEPFAPLHPPIVTIYNCGPTVYDHFHLGNARNFVFMDMVRRYLAYRGYQVRFVQNLTDIDDKIINKANAEGTTTDAVVEKYIPLYFEDADKLRIARADAHPRATEHVGEIVQLIEQLMAKGLAYATAGSVYFSVRGFAEYGKLSGRRTEDMLEGARVEVSEEKRDAADFALWKAAKPGEPTWDSPWGAGRPGWHIECSAMAMKHLGTTIDIHAGGTDLMFPHHENEIAQSEGATGQTFARLWMHNGFLNIDHQKMSKSLGNFMKIDQVLGRAPVEAVRHFLLSAHYRSPLDLTETALNESASAVKRINDGLQTGAKVLELQRQAAGSESDETRALRERFEAAMDDDFNTPRAMSVLFDAVTAIHEARQAHPPQLERLASLVLFTRELQTFFGLEESVEAGETPGDGALANELMKIIIEARKSARQHKAYAVADLIRDKLNEAGIVLEDHPQGTIWKRK